MKRLHQHQQIPPNKASSSLCHACQLGCHIRLPFYPSESISVKPFQLLHCNLWTSPIASTFGFGYYLILVDDYTHYFWTFLLRKKSDVFVTFTTFHAYARTNLTSLSLLSNVTMAANSTTNKSILSSLNMAPSFVSPVPTHLNKTVKPNEPFAPPTMFFAPYSFKPLCIPLSGPKRYTLLPS
jgi:hypothetical protein